MGSAPVHVAVKVTEPAIAVWGGTTKTMTVLLMATPEKPLMPIICVSNVYPSNTNWLPVIPSVTWPSPDETMFSNVM